MNFRQLGRTELQISEISSGGAYLMGLDDGPEMAQQVYRKMREDMINLEMNRNMGVDSKKKDAMYVGEMGEEDEWGAWEEEEREWWPEEWYEWEANLSLDFLGNTGKGKGKTSKGMQRGSEER